MITLNPEQILLRDSVTGYLRDRHSFETRHLSMQSEEGWSSGLWRGLALDLGLFGASLPESVGGFGGGATETMVIMEVMGAALVAEPVMETMVLARSLQRAGSTPVLNALWEGVLGGGVRLAFAYAEPEGRYSWSSLRTLAARCEAGWSITGHKAVVVGAPIATHFVVSARTSHGTHDRAGVSLYLVDAGAAGIRRRDYRMIDGRLAAEVAFEGVEVADGCLIGPEGGGCDLLETMIDEATVAVCAEACGVMQRLLDDTVDYTKQRKQFGQAVGRFQVLQHRMANMYIALELATSIMMMATEALDRDEAWERARLASAAKAQVGKACRFVGQSAVQLHGAMGVTDELAIGHYFKRATVIESQFGSTDHHVARFERLSRCSPT